MKKVMIVAALAIVAATGCKKKETGCPVCRINDYQIDSSATRYMLVLVSEKDTLNCDRKIVSHDEWYQTNYIDKRIRKYACD